MGKKTSKSSRLSAILLVLINLITMTCFVVLFALSTWMISSPQTLSAAIQSTGSSLLKGLLPREVLTVQLGVGLAAVSSFFIFLSFMGFYGAVGRSPFLLFMYAILILLLLLLECSLLYYFSTGLVEKGLQTRDGQWTHALRLIFQCCEYNFTTFDPAVQKSLPWSCCGPEAYPDNCTVAALNNKQHQYHQYKLSQLRRGVKETPTLNTEVIERDHQLGSFLLESLRETTSLCS